MPDSSTDSESTSSTDDRRRVIIIGGGLAGLAAASALSSRGLSVQVLESRPRLGGRASSIVDRQSGQTIDNCQHVAMGCCTSFLQFCEQTGCADLFETQRELYFVGPPGNAQVVRLAASRLPAPLHLAPSFAGMSWFTLSEKRQIAFGLRALARDHSSKDRTFQNWLDEQQQSAVVQRRFWHLVLVSALSESLDRISVQAARKVFVDGFLASRDGWQVSLPTRPLDELYETRIAESLRRSGVSIRTRTGVRSVQLDSGRVTAVELRDGSTMVADEFVLAVPHYLVRSMLPADVGQHPDVSGIDQLETAPIASVHLWYNQPLTDLPHATFVDRLSQWMFHRTDSSALGTNVLNESGSELESSYCLQVVISAARDLSQMSEQEVIAQVDSELREVWQGSDGLELIHGRLITEHRAVFSPLPGSEVLRPLQQSPIANLQFAGDWTRTGWPATMEGAVRSGYLAAENVLRRTGEPEKLLAPDLPVARLYRWLFS